MRVIWLIWLTLNLGIRFQFQRFQWSGVRDVFPEELLDVTPERQVDLRIDLVSGAAPISKELY